MLSRAYGGEAMKKSNVSEYHKRFKVGRKNVDDDERSDSPRSHRTDENVQYLVHSDSQSSYYVETLKRLHQALYRKTPELWVSDWIRHHDIGPAHKALSVKKFLTKIYH